MKEAKTHRVIVVEGWGDDKATITAAATYLVGLLATTVSRALHVRVCMEDRQEDRLELLKNVKAIVGSRKVSLDEKQKTDQRNPWIAEGLWHLCLLLASRRHDLFPIGHVLALDYPHIAAKDHGFDVVALFSVGNAVGMCIVESKAYERDPNKAINDAVGFFEGFDKGKHDSRARQTVAALRESLPKELQPSVSASLWKDLRAYVPNPHYDASVAMDWTNKRPSFESLAVKRELIAIMPHAVASFVKFFDAIGDSMLNLAESFHV